MFSGCGWFGIQTWIGGEAIYEIFLALGVTDAPYLGDWIGLNLLQLFCFLVFWAINMFVMYRGPETIKKLEYFASPFLFIMGLTLFIWAWAKVIKM